jgi:cytidylate kinase
MKIINTGLFYFGTDGTAYHGKIKLTEKEFSKAFDTILKDRKVNKQYLGTGKYPYLSKIMFIQDIAKGIRTKKVNQYAVRVSATQYIINMFKNESRYHYKPQNYIIEVIK